MTNSGCKNSCGQPLYLTLVFMFGLVIGMLTSDWRHGPWFHSVAVIGLATTAFHLTYSRPNWLSKFLRKVS